MASRPNILPFRLANRSIRYGLFGVYFLVLAFGCGFYGLHFTKKLHRYQGIATSSPLTGNDGISWRSTEKGILVDKIHPLRSLRPLLTGLPREGDRLRKIDYEEVRDPATAERLARALQPGRTMLYTFERDVGTGSSQIQTIPLVTGTRLAFFFNESPLAWTLGVWGVGLGAFGAFIALLVLLPLYRQDRSARSLLMAVVGAGGLVFGLLLVRVFVLLANAEFSPQGFEKTFVPVWMAILFVYAILYLALRAGPGRKWIALPGLLTGLALVIFTATQLVEGGNYRWLQNDIERLSWQFFFLHVIFALLVGLLTRTEPFNPRRYAMNGAVALFAIILSAYFTWESHPSEFATLAAQGLLFFPLFNAAYYPFRFGKVTLVLTRALQGVLFFALLIGLYVLVRAFSQTLLPEGPYRAPLEVMVVAGLMGLSVLGFRRIQSQLANYFVTQQQEKWRELRAFLASLPRFTQAHALRQRLAEALSVYFGAEPARVWWFDPENESVEWESIYELLDESDELWSRNKELVTRQLPPEAEAWLASQPYHLVVPLTVDATQFGLVLLGKKQHGVYNLSDLERLGQVLQQARLSLSVLRLQNRERSLLQRTYEANLTALRSQINPHFLFNTLNTISALIHDAPDTAEEAVEKLAFIFRHTLQHSDQNLLPLKTELELVNTYLEIEQIRFGDRLEVTIDWESDLGEVPLPAFAVQTLAENCIKHGIAKIIGPGRVSIHAYSDGQDMAVEVIDNGPGIDVSRVTSSTGLSNVLARFENLYGDSRQRVQFEGNDAGTKVCLRVPIGEKAR